MNLKNLTTALVAVVASLAFAASASAISVNITQPTDNSFHAATPQLSFTTTGIQLVKSCYYDSLDNLVEPCSSPVTFPQLSDGVHEYTVDVTNLDETEFVSDTVEFTIDTTFPLLSISATPDPGIRNATTINLSATVFDANRDKVECKVNTGEWYDCAITPATGAIIVNNVTEGHHSYSFRATDKAGNSAVATRYFTIDRTAPTASITSNWGDATVDTTPEFLIAASDTNFITRTCRIVTLTSPVNCADASWSPPPLSDGQWVFELAVTDAAQNVTKSQKSFTVDTTAPSYTINSFPGDQTSSTTPTITFSATDPLAVSHRCAIDPVDENWNLLVACDSGSFTPASPLALGRHKFFYEVRDALGNFDFTIYEFFIFPPALLPNDSVAAAVVSLKAKSGKVKRGKFVSTVTVTIRPKGAVANTCSGRVAVKLASRKRKPVVKRATLKLVKGACIGTAKIKLPKALKGKKAKLTASYAGGSGIGAFEFGVSLRKL